MFDRVVVARDLADVSGAVLARAGEVVSVTSVRGAARAAVPGRRLPLARSAVASDLHLPLAEAPFRHLFRGEEVRSAVARVVLSARLPPVLFEELRAMQATDPARYRHAVATAAVTARLLMAAVGEAPALPDLAAAGLLHDLGMRHVPLSLARSSGGLDAEGTRLLAAHPLLGALHLARHLGAHPAVEAALCHHWKSGAGYPALARSPSRSVEVVGVASAFVALTQARPYRSGAYDARGAADVLIDEARAGHADRGTVRLLVHALRGSKGDSRSVLFGRQRVGQAPAVNRHTPIAPTAAAL
ncbi:MAG TPA: HD domain-containing phosphohydrolase [Anaeromyxobacteraceae bacterium]|nr:HD domain-containing phosphohydrolase [Anaeromyxobacteraceae bacterium]